MKSHDLANRAKIMRFFAEKCRNGELAGRQKDSTSAAGCLRAAANVKGCAVAEVIGSRAAISRPFWLSYGADPQKVKDLFCISTIWDACYGV